MVKTNSLDSKWFLPWQQPPCFSPEELDWLFNLTAFEGAAIFVTRGELSNKGALNRCKKMCSYTQTHTHIIVVS